MAKKLIRVRVVHDQDCEGPREYDNAGTMACWHRRYKLGDVQPTCTPAEYIADLPADSLILPLYLMDHSGITMSTSGFACPWDSGQVGIIHIAPDKIREEWGEAPDAREKAAACLKAEVAVYAQYLEGQCYGYVIEEGKRCNHGDVHWEQTDSCWGFIGSDPFENGMSEHVPTNLHDQLRQAAEQPEY